MKGRIIKFNDGVCVKLHNKKTFVFDSGDDIGILFKRLYDKDDRPSCSYEVVKGKIQYTRLKLTKEGAQALIVALHEYLKDSPE